MSGWVDLWRRALGWLSSEPEAAAPLPGSVCLEIAEYGNVVTTIAQHGSVVTTIAEYGSVTLEMTTDDC